jgi:hypothetical protein
MQDNEGNTPLHYIATHHRPTHTELLKYKPDMTIYNKEGYTALDLAFTDANIYMLDAFLECDFYADERTLYLALVYTQDFDYIEKLLYKFPKLVTSRFVDLWYDNANMLDIQDMMVIVRNCISMDAQTLHQALDNLITLELQVQKKY